jgi:hypothetical protein
MAWGSRSCSWWLANWWRRNSTKQTKIVNVCRTSKCSGIGLVWYSGRSLHPLVILPSAILVWSHWSYSRFATAPSSSSSSLSLPLHEELIWFISNTNLFMNDWHLFKQYSFVVLLQHHEFLAWFVIGVRELWQRTFCCEGLGELWPTYFFLRGTWVWINCYYDYCDTCLITLKPLKVHCNSFLKLILTIYCCHYMRNSYVSLLTQTPSWMTNISSNNTHLWFFCNIVSFCHD